ncbi:ADP-ribosylation factor [Lyophyllum atratum]|nr:ADP-ribosylation factor [Lyophyllum atratum]
MSAIIRRLMDKLYPRNGYTVFILGLRDSGKTTLLYLLKLGEIVQAIPSIGFNVETFDAPTAGGGPLKLECWDFGAGCASDTKVSPVFLSFAARGDAVIWVIDGSSRDLLSESVETLEFVLQLVDSERRDPGISKDYPVLLLANKQNLPNLIPIDDIRKAFAKVLSGRMSCIFKTSANQDIEKTGLPDAFEWLRFALENAAAGRLTPATMQAMPDQRAASLLTEKIAFWVLRAENESDPQEFISQFHSLSLPAWDHYTHIRIAFLLLTIYGRQKGKDIIFDGIEKYIAESPQTRGRTFHVTMTYFWIQVVHLAIRNISHQFFTVALPVSARSR